MFNRVILTGIAFIQVAFLQAQNLVPNPSFEDTIHCPNSISQISYAQGWYAPTQGTSDYFNSCNHTTVFWNMTGLPQNCMGWENAKSGMAYAGIFTTDDARHHPNPSCAPCNDYREYIQTRLTDTLKAGLKYEVSFYVSLADSVIYACNNIGAYFSAIPVGASNFWVLPYTPQISNDPIANPLTSKNGWTLVTDRFTAAGGELYITIGNFKDSAQSDTIFMGNGGIQMPTDSSSYYYIDDVKVWFYDSLKTGINENENNVFKLYPNPSNGVFEITNNKFKIESTEIYNVYGIKVYSSSQQQLQINLSDHPSGVYFLRLKTSEGIIERKIIIKK